MKKKMTILTAAFVAGAMLFTACGSKADEGTETTAVVAESATSTEAEETTVSEETESTEVAITEKSMPKAITEETTEETAATTTLSVDMFSGTAFGDMSQLMEYLDEFSVGFLFDEEDNCIGTEIVMVFNASLPQDDKDYVIEETRAQYGECRVDGDKIVFDGAAMTGISGAALKGVDKDLILAGYEEQGYTVRVK